MFILILVLLMGLLGIGCYSRYKILKNRCINNEWDVGACTCIIIGTVLFMASIVITMFAYASQTSDFEELKRLDKYEQIYLFKSEVLTKKFKKYLLDIYPQHEKDIFNKVKSQDIDIYLVRYPELKASETIKLLVGEIRTLQNDYYAQGLLKASVVKNITYRTKNPWLYYFLIPKHS